MSVLIRAGRLVSSDDELAPEVRAVYEALRNETALPETACVLRRPLSRAEARTRALVRGALTTIVTLLTALIAGWEILGENHSYLAAGIVVFALGGCSLLLWYFWVGGMAHYARDPSWDSVVVAGGQVVSRLMGDRWVLDVSQVARASAVREVNGALAIDRLKLELTNGDVFIPDVSWAGEDNLAVFVHDFERLRRGS